MNRNRFSLGPVLGYHGCERALVESVLAGETLLRPSEKDFDWLGPGVYFWADSPRRALDWARRRSRTGDRVISSPAVLGAFIHPGLCLNLTDYGVIEELRAAHRILSDALAIAETPMPVNSAVMEGIPMRRSLDCAVIKAVHQLRKEEGLEGYDTVYGVFEEGEPLFPGSALRDKTHVQIAVCNPECILGYFRVPEAASAG